LRLLQIRGREKMIHVGYDVPFISAAGNGHIEAMKFLIDKTPNQEERNKIHASLDNSFLVAASNGHIEVLRS